jgi:hypothetical protein
MSTEDNNVDKLPSREVGYDVPVALTSMKPGHPLRRESLDARGGKKQFQSGLLFHVLPLCSNITL